MLFCHSDFRHAFRHFDATLVIDVTPALYAAISPMPMPRFRRHAIRLR
jgi:hypothetical protein